MQLRQRGLRIADDADLDLARDIGATKAGQGAEVLREWWTGLTPALRRALADDLPGWKETAGASA